MSHLQTVGKRIAFMTLGLISTTLGIIGVWLPGLPTTIFILIALWAFSKSSQRLHRWLTRIPILKSALNEATRFQREGTVDTKVKFVSQACSWISVGVVATVTHNLLLILIVSLLALSCSVFMYVTPSRSHESLEQDP